MLGSVIRVGVTGHRTLDRDSETGRVLVGHLETALRRLASVPEGEAPRLRLVSPLAEGADRIAAHVALELQATPGGRVELLCPLPFPQAVYEKDFETEASLDEFQGLLAEADEVVELEGGPDAYAAVGAFVLAHCDVLLALWDGKAARGPGGTGEVVAHALERGIPVLHIDSEGRRAPRVLPPEEGAWEEALVALAERRLRA